MSSSTPTSHEGGSALSPREQALLAAEQRARGLPAVTTPDQAHQAQPSAPFNPSRADILTFSRIMDSQAVETLTTLKTLLTNILSPPNPNASSKYRQIRLSNPLIQRTIMDISNGSPHDYLVASGFRRQTIEFVPYLVFSPSPSSKDLHRLKVGLHVLDMTLKRAVESDEREKRYRESENEAEKRRKEKALLEFEEDRRLRQEKDERERIVRGARANQPSPPVIPRQPSPVPQSRSRAQQPQAPRTVLRQHRSRGIIMGEEEGTPPPAYGELHGRVLGTGLPPDAVDVSQRGVQMVHQQDLEDTDEEEEEY